VGDLDLSQVFQLAAAHFACAVEAASRRTVSRGYTSFRERLISDLR
jgi:hypothetical protein